MKEDFVKHIEKAISDNNFEMVIKELSKLKGIRSYSVKDKLRLSEWYLWANEPDKALKVLGDLASENELLSMTQEEIPLQIRHAYLLNFLGAKYVAMKHFETIEIIIKERKIPISTIYPKYFEIKGKVYLSSYIYADAAKYFKKSLELSSFSNRLNMAVVKVSLADCYNGLGNYEETRDLIFDLLAELSEEEITLKSMCHEVLGESYLFEGNLSKARFEFNSAWKYLKDKEESKDMAYLCQMSGACYVLAGEEEKAEKELLRGLSILDKKNSQPIAKMSFFYWLEACGNSIGISDKLMVRAHHSFSPYRYLLGKSLNPNNKNPLPKWIEDKYTPSDADCWLLREGEIKSINYDDIRIEKNKDFWDLCSGLINKDEVFTFLTEIESSTLNIIVGSGSAGVSEWALIDYVYRQEFIHPSIGIDRIKKIIKQLKKKGFEIETKDRHFKVASNNLTIILPMDNKIRGQHAYFMKNCSESEFKRSDLENFFSITKSMANRWIGEWEEKEIISSKGNGKAKVYSIKKAS